MDKESTMAVRLILICILLIFPIAGDSEGVKYNSPTITSALTEVDALSYEELYSIFTLSKLYWDNGLPITIVLMPHNYSAHRFFVENYIGLGVVSYRTKIDRIVSKGNVKPPIYVDGNLEMVKKIKTIVGSIGYLDGDIYISKADAIGIIPVEIK